MFSKSKTENRVAIDRRRREIWIFFWVEVERGGGRSGLADSGRPLPANAVRPAPGSRPPSRKKFITPLARDVSQRGFRLWIRKKSGYHILQGQGRTITIFRQVAPRTKSLAEKNSCNIPESWFDNFDIDDRAFVFRVQSLQTNEANSNMSSIVQSSWSFFWLIECETTNPEFLLPIHVRANVVPIR